MDFAAEPADLDAGQAGAEEHPSMLRRSTTVFVDTLTNGDKRCWPRWLDIKTRSKIYKVSSVIVLVLAMLSVLGKKVPWSKADQQVTIFEVPGWYNATLGTTEYQACNSLGSDDGSCGSFIFLNEGYTCYRTGRGVLLLMLGVVWMQLMSLILILSHKKIKLPHGVMYWVSILAIIASTAGPVCAVLTWDIGCHSILTEMLGYLNPGADIVETTIHYGP